jgi:hypothetical protein
MVIGYPCVSTYPAPKNLLTKDIMVIFTWPVLVYILQVPTILSLTFILPAS